jgi:hypothetical protein
MTTLRRFNEWPWAGLAGGAAFWYAAHDIGFYYSGHDCKYQWAIRLVHVLTLLACIYCSFISVRVWGSASDENPDSGGVAFGAGISAAAGILFSIVILWQGIAAFVFSGCSR